MKIVILKCPKCECGFHYKNYWHWVWKAPFHWLWWDKKTNRIRDYRLTKCPHCDERSWMKREK